MLQKYNLAWMANWGPKPKGGSVFNLMFYLKYYISTNQFICLENERINHFVSLRKQRS